MGLKRTRAAQRARTNDRMPFDVRPMMASLFISLALTAILISLNSGDSSVGSLAIVETDAERVDARAAGSARPGREAVSPALASNADSIAEADPADRVVPANSSSADSASVDGSAADTLAEVTSDQTLAAGTEFATNESAQDVPPTTASIGSAPQPSSVTSSPIRSVVVTTTTRPSFGQVAAAPTTVRPTISAPTTTVRQTTVAPTTAAPTTAAPTTAAPTTAAPQSVSGRYSIAQVIDGTISAGDGSNPNEESPMGRHAASLYLPQNWDWTQGTTRNPQWGTLRSNQFVEFRCAVIPENGHVPPVDFRINFREGAYYQFANNSWSKAFDVALDAPSHGAYLGAPGQVNSDPFATGRGSIEWRQEADGSYSAPWNSNALMMHFWASERQSPASGQTAEFLTSEMRIQQPDGGNVDLSQVRVLFQCGLDYYNSTGGQGTKVPGPGIGKYHRLNTQWNAGLWVTLPGNVPASGVSDFRTWLSANLPPDVGS